MGALFQSGKCTVDGNKLKFTVNNPFMGNIDIELSIDRVTPRSTDAIYFYNGIGIYIMFFCFVHRRTKSAIYCNTKFKCVY